MPNANARYTLVFLGYQISREDSNGNPVASPMHEAAELTYRHLDYAQLVAIQGVLLNAGNELGKLGQAAAAVIAPKS